MQSIHFKGSKVFSVLMLSGFGFIEMCVIFACMVATNSV